ncbi:roadblock/LC7 domain-containing protein [Ottowia thiooxydans]|uniref:roadblock/LC7 domain-containing protein n=1 Tax=Ottowia thiooxydans TaxID=219182 RepID=UPI0003FD726F|nr:roadblock/LC7 domain-containing protein [Ottowia thiooxydans]
MSTNLNLAPGVKEIASREAELFLNEVNGVTAVVVASIDGFDIAAAMKHGDAARVAAMASSISAIGSVVSQEANLGRSKSVTINTESGFAMVYAVHRTDAELIVNVIADGNAILAQVAYRAAEFSRTLANI